MPTPRSPRASAWPAIVTEDPVEQRLATLLDQGSTEAGLELVTRLEGRADRRPALVNVCRRLTLMMPGHRGLLDRLHNAASADHDAPLAAAVAHARDVFLRGVERHPPPPLAAQPEEPERVRALLFRDVAVEAGEALAMVWESAAHVFRRDPASYGVTGLERVSFGAPTVLSRVYTVAARALGITSPLFQRRGPGDPHIGVLMLVPPALLLSGEVRRDTPQLAYHVGAMLAATLPENVMLFGSSEEHVHTVLRALALAFGPPAQSTGNLTGVASLAEILWERIPARAQRRLRELCERPDTLDYGLAMASARRGARRAGLLVCGDLEVALQEVALELGYPVAELRSPGGLGDACAAHPEMADLVRVATSPEYAEARWRTLSPRAG